jgi:tripartite-type tricarboxylate transporter receptor subunit TctC
MTQQGRGGEIQMKRMKRFFALGLAVLTVVLLSGIPPVQAQPYPSHSIQVVIPGAPGDALDLAGRIVIEEMEKILKVPMVVVNKPGGGASVGTDFAAKSKKDGYTILYSNSSGLVYNPAFSPEECPYNTLRDFEPLGLHVTFPDGIWVKTEAPWKDFPAVIEYSKKNPGKFRCGTLGIGSINHFRIEMIKSITGADITLIPFKGAMPALTALLGDHVESSFTAVAITFPHYQSGKVRPMVMDQKVDALPGAPTLQDLGYKRALPLTFFAFLAPMGIPEEAKKVLVSAIEKASNDPEVVTKLKGMKIAPNYKPPAGLKQMLSEDYENARQIVKQTGMKK